MRLLLLIFLGTTFSVYAQSKKSLDVSRVIKIVYGSPSWNKDSTKIDTAYLVLRDKNTGKILHVQLEETEPDSSQFEGSFSVTLGEADKVSPELYIPPNELRSGDKDYKKLYGLIQGNQLPRKPLIVRKNDRGQSIVDVYDTREQAEAALKAYQEQQRLAQEQKKKKLTKPVTSEQNLAAAQQAERKAALDKMALEAANREAERVRLEQIEKQKAEEALRQAKAITESERARRRAQAAKLLTAANGFYAAGDFASAENNYREASSLDPENKDSYFKYGVSLYRNQKFNEALVALKLAHLENQTDLERKYFMGLCFYRLGELESSQKAFSEVVASQDATLAPSALFYTGVLQFTKEQFEESKKSFEGVIDTSNDPKMDQQAEDYLDRIAQALIYKKMRENKFIVSGTLGLMYDSNVLLSPDNTADQGATTNVSDARLLTMAEIDYRPIFSEHHEWSANLSGSLTNSLKTESAKADPFLYDLALPYSYKGVLWKKGYKLSIKPVYEILYMDPTGTGTKFLILSSFLIDIDNTFIMSKDWFSTYTLEYRSDDSKTADSIGPEDADSKKYTLKTTQAVFLDKSKKEVLLGTLGYILNSARGTHKKFNRYDLGATYVRPLDWGQGASWSLGLAAYQLNYPSTDPLRKDLNVSLNLGLNKPIKEWVTWGVIGSYSKNNSSVDSNAYSKYMIMTTASFNTSF